LIDRISWFPEEEETKEAIIRCDLEKYPSVVRRTLIKPHRYSTFAGAQAAASSGDAAGLKNGAFHITGKLHGGKVGVKM